MGKGILGTSMATATNPTRYMLLFRNTGPETHEHLSPAQRDQLLTNWNAWYDGVAAQGKAIEGQPLELAGRIVAGARGQSIKDGPFAEAKEAIGGYVKLTVDTLEEATKIAQEHPGLQYGLVIEVRPLVHACHLGCTSRKSP